MSLDNLPVEWSVIDLESLSEFIIGGDWGKDTSLAEENYIEAFCIRGAEFKNWKTDKGKTAVLRKLKTSSLDTRRLKVGDILVEISGGGPDQPVGRTLYIEELVFNNLGSKDIVCTNFLRLFRPTTFINAKYLNFYLSFFYKTPEIVNYQSGSNNLRNLQFKDYLKLEIPMAPLAEQQEIVRQLDVMLAQVEQIKARLDAIPAILKKFRQSVLADAVSGRLVEKNHSIWVEKNLSELTLKITDGEHLTPPIVESGVPLLSAKDVHEQYIDFSNCKYIERSIADKALSRCNPQYHDLLVVSRGATVGRTHYLKNSREFCLMGSVLLIRANMALIQPAYLDIFFKSELGRKQLISSSGASAQQAIYIRDVKKMKVSYPSIEVQEDIIVQVNTLFKFIEKIEFTVQSAQKRVNLLTQSILAKAFSGELTAEWREQHQDLITGINSAESLLAKIQAAREANKPVKKTRVKKDA